ncbi:MAG: transcriptional regulator [Candidatus Methanomethylophilaceae archaeon]|jgi:predicted transcriptional regulator
MYFPCELIVTDVLPTARSALARSLIERHGYKQIDVARSFGVTGSAVSQYLKGVRGSSQVIDDSPQSEGFYKMIDTAADAIAEGLNSVELLCDVCRFVKDSGLIHELCAAKKIDGKIVNCVECPRVNMTL